MCCSYGFGGYKIDYAGSSYGGLFVDGLEEVVSVGPSCTASAATALHPHRYRTKIATMGDQHAKDLHYAKATSSSLVEVDADAHQYVLKSSRTRDQHQPQARDFEKI